MTNFEVNAYFATVNLERDTVRDFQAGSDPARALEDAKRWVESEARTYIKKNPTVLSEGQWEAGSITALSVDGPANEPTATLFVRSVKGKPELDWHE